MIEKIHDVRIQTIGSEQKQYLLQNILKLPNEPRFQSSKKSINNHQGLAKYLKFAKLAFKPRFQYD